MRDIKSIGFVCIGLLVAGGVWGCSDDDASSVCGNGLIEGSEQCDDVALGGNDCTSVPGDFTGGTLTCANDCTFDTSQCNNDTVECGDGEVNQTSEDCDGTDLDGNGCADVGNYTGGTLACANDCTFDTSNCEAEELCGNGAIDTGEDCDTDNLNGNDCTDVGNFTGGTLACANDCTYNTSGCENVDPCGNGAIDSGEDCDGTNLDGNTCADAGSYNSGDLACANDCTFDVSSCVFVTPTEQIAAVRAVGDGTGLSLPVENVWVTYLKPAVGNDPAGFAVQAEQLGPALFVTINPATLSPAPQVGDEVSFTVTEKDSNQGRDEATAVTGWTVVSNGNPVSNLAQTVTDATDLVSALDDYEVELISVDATLMEDMGYAGAGHQSAQIDTDAITGNVDLQLRIPDTLQTQLDLQAGCTVSVTETPLWRYFSDAQVIAYDASEIAVTSCPAPQVVSATATGDATVLLVMSRNIDPTSVLASGSQFTFDNGLTANAASSMGNEITVLTSVQTAGATYVVTVAASVTDLLGTGVDAAANTATFQGFGTPAVEGACDDGIDGDGDGYIDCEDAECASDAACTWADQLYLLEADADQLSTDSEEFIELYNAGSTAIDFSTAKYFVLLVNGSDDLTYDAVQLTGTLAAGDVYLLGPSSMTGVDIAWNGGAWVVGTTETNRLQNGPDGILLVRCDACTTAAAEFPIDTDPTTNATFTTAASAVATKVDGLAYDTNDSDDASLMGVCGVSAQWDEDMNGEGINESLHRTSANGWTATTPSPGAPSFE